MHLSQAAVPLFIVAFGSIISPNAFSQAAPGSILRVGKGEQFSLPSQAAAAAHDGDTIEIAAGTYPGDTAVWRASHLKIRGIGGRPLLDSQGHVAEGKAIWVIKGDDTLVESVEFTGAAVPDKNGAGIRQEGNGLTVQNCSFHDNEDGILAGALPNSDIIIENCEFNHNGQGDGESHNMYIGHVRRFVLRGCYIHNANVGHNVKSRAAVTEILYNRIADDDTSNTSYEINVPNGGLCYVIGNIIRRGPAAGQAIFISFAEEGATNPQQALYVVNNTLVNDRGAATFVRVAGGPTVRLVNNLFIGGGTQLMGGTGDASHNLVAKPADVQAAPGYLLRAGSPAIDAGIDPGKVGDYNLTPRYEYAAPLQVKPRPVHGTLDIGANESDAPGAAAAQ